jgi:hypothetical protein
LILASLNLNSFVLEEVTLFEGSEFQGWTTRLEKKYLTVLFFVSRIDTKSEGVSTRGFVMSECEKVFELI